MEGTVATGVFRAEHGTPSNKKLGLTTLLRAPIKETNHGEKQRKAFIQCGFMGRRTDKWGGANDFKSTFRAPK